MSRKIKFNGMDIFIVAILVVVIAAGAFLLLGNDGNTVNSSAETQTEVTFTVELTARDEDYTKILEVGDIVLVGEKEKTEATVADVKIIPATDIGYDILDGRVLHSEIPGKYDVHVTLKGRATETNEYVKHGMLELRVGQGVALSNKDWTGYGYIIAIDTAA